MVVVVVVVVEEEEALFKASYEDRMRWMLGVTARRIHYYTLGIPSI